MILSTEVTYLWDKRGAELEDLQTGRTVQYIWRAGTPCREPRAGLSQEQLAVRLQLDGLGLTQKAISRMETGERVVADYELVHLARALEVGVLELLGLEP